MCVLFSSLGRYRYSTKKNGRQTDLGGDQRRLKLFTYVHGVPEGINMGGNTPTYFLVKSKVIISCQSSSGEECASNRVNKPLHLVTTLLATVSLEKFNEIDTTVDI